MRFTICKPLVTFLEDLLTEISPQIIQETLSLLGGAVAGPRLDPGPIEKAIEPLARRPEIRCIDHTVEMIAEANPPMEYQIVVDDQDLP